VADPGADCRVWRTYGGGPRVAHLGWRT